ncbi:MAG: hypothetical protein HKN69_01730 [Desulfofustis sp.]|nr:hypothetical protein [Desulfofustis sp.]
MIEGDHGSFFCHPLSDNIAAAVDCFVRLQSQKGDDALVGRRLYPLLSSCGFDQVEVSPRNVYAATLRPDVVSRFSKKNLYRHSRWNQRRGYRQWLQFKGKAAEGNGRLQSYGWPKGNLLLHFF